MWLTNKSCNSCIITLDFRYASYFLAGSEAPSVVKVKNMESHSKQNMKKSNSKKKLKSNSKKNMKKSHSTDPNKGASSCYSSNVSGVLDRKSCLPDTDTFKVTSSKASGHVVIESTMKPSTDMDSFTGTPQASTAASYYSSNVSDVVDRNSCLPESDKMTSEYVVFELTDMDSITETAQVSTDMPEAEVLDKISCLTDSDMDKLAASQESSSDLDVKVENIPKRESAKDSYDQEWNVPLPDRREYDRPCFSFNQLIAQALMSAKRKALTAKQIVAFISATYPYYKLEDLQWQVCSRERSQPSVPLRPYGVHLAQHSCVLVRMLLHEKI